MSGVFRLLCPHGLPTKFHIIPQQKIMACRWSIVYSTKYVYRMINRSTARRKRASDATIDLINHQMIDQNRFIAPGLQWFNRHSINDYAMGYRHQEDSRHCLQLQLQLPLIITLPLIISSLLSPPFPIHAKKVSQWSWEPPLSRYSLVSPLFLL